MSPAMVARVFGTADTHREGTDGLLDALRAIAEVGRMSDSPEAARCAQIARAAVTRRQAEGGAR